MTKEDLFEFIIEKYKTALKLFGTYSFDDKGPEDVMDIDYIVEELKNLNLEDRMFVLGKLITYDKRTPQIVSSFLYGTDRYFSDEEWEQMFTMNPKLEELY